MNSAESYDVIIVGGGLAGCATALALGNTNTNASFLVIDDADRTSFKVGESLPPEASRVLQDLSPALPTRLAQDTALGMHTKCTGNASVWESSDLHETFAIMNPFGMGWHLNRAVFDESLRDAVRDLCTTNHSGCESPLGDFTRKLEKSKFIAVEEDEKGWVVSVEELESKTIKQYHAKWVIDATGRKATLAHKLGAKTIKADSLLAFYAVFSSPTLDPDHRTLIEATQTGWWYSSQLADNTRIVVYHTDDSDPSSKCARKREGFLNLLYADTVHISQTIDENDYHPLPGSNFPRCTAACSSLLEPLGDEDRRWYAVGDAAMAFDPLSSQGMITALRMGCSVGMMLSENLNAAMQKRTKYEEVNSVDDIYLPVRKDYEEKKKYFYGQARFDGDFWMRRRL